MTIAEARAILIEYNAWRRDDEGGLTMLNPTQIGIAIDTVCAALDQHPQECPQEEQQ